MKILVVGQEIKQLNSSICKALATNGIEISLFEHEYGLRKRNYLQRVRVKLGLDIDAFLHNDAKKFCKKLLSVYRKFIPDVVIVLKGIQITREALGEMKERAIVTLSLTDSIQEYPIIFETANMYDLIYSFEKSDIDILNSRGVNCGVLMGAVDTDIYNPLEVEKAIDVSFAGAMYPTRIKILRSLVNEMPDIKFEIYGEYASIRHPIRLLSWYTNKREHNCFKNRNISVGEVNQLYNSSKIVLNIHHEQSKDGWNARLPEILATKSFEIVDHNPSIVENFSGCVETFSNIIELKEKIRYYLEHDTERSVIAIDGYDVAIKKHTVALYMGYILDDINFAIKKCKSK